MGPNQTSKLLYSKGNHKQNEKTACGMGEIPANDVTDKGLISKIYKQLMQLSLSLSLCVCVCVCVCVCILNNLIKKMGKI